MRALTWLTLAACGGALLASPLARAQAGSSAVELVDPDAKARPKRKPSRSPAPPAPVAPAPVTPQPVQPVPAAAKPGPGEGPPAEARPPEKRASARPTRAPKVGEADLESAWQAWRSAAAKKDEAAERSARERLVQLKVDLGATNLDEYAMGLLRSADARVEAGDLAGAIDDALTAVELAPDLPHVHLGLARTYFGVDATDLGRYLTPGVTWVRKLAEDPRFLRPVVADLGTALLFALMATAGAVTLVLFARRIRYFFHDFHHLFPRAAARWQTAAAALMLLALPIVFRLGIVPVLLVAFGATSLYLGRSERVVGAVLLSLLGLVPPAAEQLVRRTAFAGTVAEEVYLIERGGPGAEALAGKVIARAKGGKAGFAELFAVGRLELRRGRLDEAVEYFKSALALRNDDAAAVTNLGNAMMARGDLEGAQAMYERAAASDSKLAAPHYNLARLFQRRAATVAPELAPIEKDKALTALAALRLRDPALADRPEPSAEESQVNRILLSPPLPAGELADVAQAEGVGVGVRDQLSARLLGAADPGLAPFLPILAVAGLFLFGALVRRLGPSTACEKCGRAVCRRCDPELGAGSALCGQCVNVFARKGVVPAPLKVRKQIEASRHQSRSDKLAYVLGLACSGAGHLYAGLPIRGALWAFGFLFVIAMVLFRHGVLRSPYGDGPMFLRLLPLGLCLLAVYLLSLRGLFKRQSG